jgi:hypothetical protein
VQSDRNAGFRSRAHDDLSVRSALAFVGLAAAAVLAFALAAVWWQHGEQTVATLATVAAVVLAATGPVASWRQGNRTIDNQLQLLADKVLQQWNEEAALRRLHDKHPLAVRWREVDALRIGHAEGTAGGGHSTGPPGAWTAPLEKVDDLFARLPQPRLVVIGKPGAGKSSVLLFITLGLLARRNKTKDPVPVLFSLASWDPTRTDLLQWLARHLSEEYPFVRPRDAPAIIKTGRVLPLLDGLDELPAGAAAAALPMINEVGFQRPLVVACRTLEFARAARAGDVLTDATVVELEPVLPGQAEKYLRDNTPDDDRLARWEPVFAELGRGPGSPLADALSTPLMLTLLRTVYALDREAKPAQLVGCPSREEIEDRLLDALVPVLYARYTRWPADRARAWLAFLAAHLHRRGTRDLAWWELARGGTMRQIARAVGLGLAVGVPAWLLADVLGRPTTDPPVGIGTIAGAGIATALGSGVGALLGRWWVGSTRPARFVLTRDRARAILLALGLVVAADVGFAFSPIAKILSDVADAVLLIGMPLFVGSILFFLMVEPSEQPPTPAFSLASDRLVSIFSIVVFSQGFTLVAAGAYLLGGDTLSYKLQSVAIVLVLSLPVALGMAAVLPWSAYQSARLWLAVLGRLPWCLFAFLEDAHQHGVLRQVGGVYQFVHARLQDRLADP